VIIVTPNGDFGTKNIFLIVENLKEQKISKIFFCEKSFQILKKKISF